MQKTPSCRRAMTSIRSVLVLLATVPVLAWAQTPVVTPPVRDLGGRTLRAEAEGFKVTLAFGVDDVKVYLTTPGLISSALHVCSAAVEGAVPAELVCDHGRKVSLVPTAQGYRVTLAGTLAGEARAFLGERRYGPQGPVVYDATPANPADLAFLEAEFRAPAGTGNRSAETEVLRAFLPARRTPPAAEIRRTIAATLAAEDIDAMTVPFDVVRSLQRAVAEGSSTPALKRILDEAAKRAARRTPTPPPP